MTQPTAGMHHFTAISGDAQANHDFYTGALGLRFVKKTVNFDDPGTYHLYYGDGAGHPGTVLTFFPWGESGRRGHPGTGQTTALALAVPEGSLDYWLARLQEAGVDASGPEELFGERYISLQDPDGIRIELVESADAKPDYAWTGGAAPPEHAIRGVHHLELLSRRPEETLKLLTKTFGFTTLGDEGNRTRLTAHGDLAALVDVLTPDDADRPGRMGAGAVHHVAWRTADEEEQLAWREKLTGLGFKVTPVQDRQYFRSIYFREPGGILFEIATDGPGFLIDETEATLGSTLKLPPQYEGDREKIEGVLPAIR